MKPDQLIHVINKHKKKLSIATICIMAGIVIATVVVSRTLSFFSDSTVATNTIHMGAVNVGVAEKQSSEEAYTLYEDYNDDTSNSNPDTSYELVAIGQEISKIVAIQNINLEDYPTVDTYVRVRLVPCFRDEAGNLMPVSVDAYKVVYTFADSTASIDTDLITDGIWKYDDVMVNDSTELYYYYTGAIEPGKCSRDLITGVTYNGEVPEGGRLELQVLVEGVAARQKDSDGNTIIDSWLGDKTVDGVTVSRTFEDLAECK